MIAARRLALLVGVLLFALHGGGGGCSAGEPAAGARTKPIAPAATFDGPAPIVRGFRDAGDVPEWMSQAEELRSLRFRHSISVHPLVRSEIAATIRAEIEAQMPEDEVEAYRDAYVALGALPRGHDLVQTFSEIYGKQMVGRYSRREGALYLLEGESAGGYSRETVAVHELVHALQDQNFGRAMALSEELEHNDDLVSALAGVIEGDATFTMLGARDLDPTTERTLAAAAEFRDGMLQELSLRVGPLARAPRLIQISVIYPYAYGVVLAAHRFLERGNAGLDDLLGNAPLSTLELLYSEPGERRPIEVEFIELPLEGWTARLEPQGCRLGHHNVAGSLTLRTLFDDYDVADARGLEAHWRGDRFLHVECPSGTELLWISRWDTEASAARFAAAYRSIASRISERARLAEIPRILERGRSVIALTPGLDSLAPDLMDQIEIRGYRNFEQWISQGCFGEGGGCPVDIGRGAVPLATP